MWLIVKLRFLFWDVVTRLLMDQVLTTSLRLGKIKEDLSKKLLCFKVDGMNV
jgi:hypothetical protein